MIVKKGQPKFVALAAIVNSVGQFRKHSIIVTLADTVELHGTYWGGGTRSTYTLVDAIRVGAIRRFPHVGAHINSADRRRSRASRLSRGKPWSKPAFSAATFQRQSLRCARKILNDCQYERRATRA